VTKIATNQPTTSSAVDYDIESTVLSRYQEGARQQQPSLCCPTEYEGNYTEILPEEIIVKDYGCGDPTRYVNPGETVVDLGSYGNTEFVKGKIQDLKLPLDKLQGWLQANPVASVDDIGEYEAQCDRLRQEEPLIGDNTVDVVISNCVLNLVRPQDKKQLFGEIFRVLKRGGRAVISDIVCDEDPTAKIMNDPDLWSGCIAGAFREDLFLKMFEDAGFYGVEILKREETPWQVIDGVEVCDKTYNIMTSCCSPYAQDVIGIAPYENIALEEAELFNCTPKAVRHARESKGSEYNLTETSSEECCTPGDCC